MVGGGAERNFGELLRPLELMAGPTLVRGGMVECGGAPGGGMGGNGEVEEQGGLGRRMTEILPPCARVGEKEVSEVGLGTGGVKGAACGARDGSLGWLPVQQRRDAAWSLHAATRVGAA